mmetsp:Transcript_74178/g.206202  ORF Transcript_74178/g.206202 Transcript_74178/m.206202 type:complete len:168 (+) Transcript_74178:54-557(+)
MAMAFRVRPLIAGWLRGGRGWGGSGFHAIATVALTAKERVPRGVRLCGATATVTDADDNSAGVAPGLVEGVVENFSGRGEALVRLVGGAGLVQVPAAAAPTLLVRQQQVWLAQDDAGTWQLQRIGDGQGAQDRGRRLNLWNNAMSGGKGKKGRRGHWDAGRGAWHGP